MHVLYILLFFFFFFFSSRRRHTRLQGDWSSDVCSSDLFESPAAHTITEPAGARWVATWSIRLSPAGHATGYAGPARRSIGPQSGRIPGSITRSRATTSASVVGESFAKAAMSMRSLRHLEEESGVPRALDRGEEGEVREHRVQARQREPGGDRCAELRGEAEVGAVRVQEVRERDPRGERRDGLRQDGDRVVEPREHEDEVHARPREGLGPIAEERDQRADEDADDPRVEEAAQDEHRDRQPPGREHTEVEGPPAEHRQQEEEGPAPRHPDQPRAEGQVPDPDGREELVLQRL